MTNLSDFFRGYPYQTAYKNANYTAVSGDYILVGSDTGAITITLPPTPSLNDFVFVSDADDNAGTNNITIARNGQTIDGNAADFIINVNGGRVDLVYDGTTWKVGYTTPGASLQFTKYIGQNLQTGTSYELVLDDAGKLITMSNASPNTLTIPANSSVAFAVNTRIDVLQLGAGQTTVAITTDTLNASGGTKINAQYEVVSLLKVAPTTWVLVGGVA